MRILYIQETDWIDKGPQQQHHILERLSEKNHVIRVIDYEVLWSKKLSNGLISPKLVLKPPAKAYKNSKIILIRPRALRIPILNYMSILITYGSEIYRQVKTFKPDVIIGTGILVVSISCFLAKINNIPFIYSVTDKFYDAIPSPIFKPLGFSLEKWLYRNSDEVIVINEQLRKYALRLGSNPRNTHVIRAGNEIELFKPEKTVRQNSRTKFNFKNDELILFFMGWLYKFSGLKEVLLRIKEIKNPLVKMFIVGEGDLSNELAVLSNELDLQDSVIIHPWVTYRELPTFIALADICLLPAYNNPTMNEIVPIKIYEYLAMEKPVIATALRGIYEEFSKGNGVLYGKKPEAVVDRAIQLWKSGKISRIGRKGRNFVMENCDWNHLVNKFELVLMKRITH